MKRRDFVATSLTATSVLGLGQAPLLAQAPALAANKSIGIGQEFYELRAYTLKPGAEPTSLHNFLRDAAIPAWNRLGSQPIGVFSLRDAGETPMLYVLIPHPSLVAFATAASRLAVDAAYRQAGAAYLDLPATDPAYVRYESALFRVCPD